MRPGAAEVATLSSVTPKFAGTADYAQGTVAVTLAGAIDLSNKQKIDELLRAVHQAARSHAAQEVIMDVRKLEFMNSSCLKMFVAWFDTIQELPLDAQYRIVFVSSPEMVWQERSLLALSCLAPGLVSIER